MKMLDLNIKIYLHKIKTNLPVNWKIKRAFINELKENINQYRRDNKNINIEDIKDKFGTPEDVLISFNNSYDYYKNKSIIYDNLTKIVVIIAIAIIIILLTVIIMLVTCFSRTTTIT